MAFRDRSSGEGARLTVAILLGMALVVGISSVFLLKLWNTCGCDLVAEQLPITHTGVIVTITVASLVAVLCAGSLVMYDFSGSSSRSSEVAKVDENFEY